VSMDQAIKQEVQPFSGTPGAAAAILARTPRGNLHAGLVFVRSGRVEFLHLAWEDRLATDWPWNGVWACPAVEPERLRSVAAMCRRVRKKFDRDRKFPYALRFDDSSFDQAGRLVLGVNARGLTCATFILAIFNSVGVVLVDEKSWPVRRHEDDGFLAFLSAHATTQHMEILRREVDEGVRRIWPDEVLGACTVSSLPVEFELARSAANTALELLDEARD